MKRNVDIYLNDWRNSNNHKILLVRGARQVGKTYSVRKLGESFKHFLEVNFEKDRAIHSFFQESLDPSGICEKLSAYYNIPIISGKTLLFFDEIQACLSAIQALRFFHEEIPDLHVAAAGSLLEFALEQIPTFGVGRITSLFMYPLSFFEFLEATKGTSLVTLLKNTGFLQKLDDALHLRVLDSFRTFLIIGGLPAVVEAYRQRKNLRECHELLDDLIETFRDDFAKYKAKSPAIRLEEAFRSIVSQAGRKFIFSHVSSHGPLAAYQDALELLVNAGLAYKVYHTSAQGIPLGAQINSKKFKVILFDQGIHQRLSGLDIADLLIEDYATLINKGALAEIFVGCELIAGSPSHSRPQLFYWHREARSSNAEVDYVIQRNNEIIPLEVKAGLKGPMKSMRIFLKERNLAKGLRVSQEKLGEFNGIQIIPIYLSGAI